MENPNLDLQECDWEVVLPNSEENIHHSSSGDGGGGAGVICSDYFSIDDSAAVTSAEVGGDGGESDNPNLVDPIAPLRSSPEDSDTDFDSGTRNSIPLQFDSGAGLGFDQSSFSDNTVVNNDVEEDDDQFSGLNSEDEDEEEKKSEDENENENNENEDEDENEKKVVVWWKVPMEVLKYCVWRVSPVWSVSMAAAALLGFVLLRRRYLYKMKRKSQDINVSVVDNKVSQLMSRAARLNEAFSVVKRIPVIRPALPAPGMTSWPVMSLR